MINLAFLMMFALKPDGTVMYRPVMQMDTCNEEFIKPYVDASRQEFLNHFAKAPVVPTFSYVCNEVEVEAPSADKGAPA